MGYYTKYSLEITSGKHELIPKVLENLKYYQPFDEYGSCIEECKWYDHEKDMRRISKLYPDEVFKLMGEGEGDGDPDLWHKYFKNGLMQKCNVIIAYPPFDESLLS